MLPSQATSALDAESEHLVQESIERVSVGRTVVIVAHRLGTIKFCDKVCVVSDGAVAELGTLPELIAKDGLYAQLARRSAFLGAAAAAGPGDTERLPALR